MTHRVVVSVAKGHQYHLGHDRLLKSLDEHAPGIDRMFWTNALPPDSPKHERVPYGFKQYAIKAAIAKGYTTIVWCDAATWACRDVRPFFDIVESEGHHFFHGGATLGQRCSDDCLRIMGFTRDEAWKIQLVGGTAVGLNMLNPRTATFRQQWWDAMLAGAFNGPAVNDIAQDDMRGLAGRGVGHISDDPRVQGHCHDESVATILLHRLGMKSTGIGLHFDGFSPDTVARPTMYWVSQGL